MVVAGLVVVVAGVAVVVIPINVEVVMTGLLVVIEPPPPVPTEVLIDPDSM